MPWGGKCWGQLNGGSKDRARQGEVGGWLGKGMGVLKQQGVRWNGVITRVLSCQK